MPPELGRQAERHTQSRHPHIAATVRQTVETASDCGSGGLLPVPLVNEWGVMDREGAHQVSCVALDLLF